MKRYYCMLVVFSLCLIVAGCRRGSSTPRVPVKVPDENVILKGPKEMEMQFASRPLDRKYKLVVESLIKLDEDRNLSEAARKKRLSDAAKLQEEMEKDNEARERLQAATDAVAQEQLEHEFAPFGLAANKYLELKKTSMPKEYVELEFYKWLRREELTVPRRYLDKVTMEIVHEKIFLHKLLGSSFTLVTDVDMDGKGYIVAYGDNIYQMNGEKKFGQASAKMIQKEIAKQELRLVRHYFAGYCGPLFIRPAVDQKESDLLFKTIGFGYRNHEDIIKRMQYGSPAAVIASFESDLPQFVINPPGAVELEKLAIYLRDKAPPSLKIPLEDRVISLNKDVNWRNPADIVACRTVVDVEENAETKQKIVYGHLSVNTIGNVSYVATPAVQRFLQEPPAERRGGGGMPGGAPPGGMKMKM